MGYEYKDCLLVEYEWYFWKALCCRYNTPVIYNLWLELFRK